MTPLFGTKNGEFRNQFPRKIAPRFRIGHTVVLAEIMARKTLEIGSLIPVLKLVNRLFESNSTLTEMAFPGRESSKKQRELARPEQYAKGHRNFGVPSCWRDAF